MGQIDRKTIKLNREGWEALRRRLGETTEIVKIGAAQLCVGDQVVYVPAYCQDPLPEQVARQGYFRASLESSGIEHGFVTSASPDGVHAWCRFWHPGIPVGELRTKSSSGRCEVTDLVPFVYVADWIVQAAMDRWCR